jgi:hypothetical protein
MLKPWTSMGPPILAPMKKDVSAKEDNMGRELG